MQKIIKYLMITAMIWGLSVPLLAHINPNLGGGKTAGNSTSATVRNDCAAGQAVTEQAINNVRATLLTSGDVWWNRADGRYIVPKVDPASGLAEVSSLYAGAVWLGGFDGSDLKIACQQYGSNNGDVDFWPGPLDGMGTTSADVCANWDRHFRVTGEEITEHIANLDRVGYSDEDIPEGVKFYPGRGNEYFVDRYGFELPTAAQGLGAFFDANGNGEYEPLEGDYPKIDIRGCPDDNPIYPDELISWFYNDAGNEHGETGGSQIRMEVQVQAFGFVTNDELNNMTFQRYKLINRAISAIDSCYFAMWVDPDLGCSTDDYIGCDTSRSLMYVYNADAFDGQTGCSCPGGVETYCDEIPMVGVDYFRGPTAPKVFASDGTLITPPPGIDADTTIELGMSSFTYYNNGGETPPPPPGTDDPDNLNEYYNYLSGRWRDGTPFTADGDGYNPGNTNVINYAFPDAPDLTNGFSMAQAGLAERDRRTVQASGPFRLESGSVNELIVGMPWVPSVSHPAPAISKLIIADDLAQALFDNCFEKNDGPDAPDVDWLELDRKVVAMLSNDTIEARTNNVNEQYTEKDLRLPDDETIEDDSYVFEGYLLYQVASPSSAGESDLNDPDHYRLAAQVDKKNGVAELYNWIAQESPLNSQESFYTPVDRVSKPAGNSGIRHTFEITLDLFTQEPLINHKKYYYRAIAYGFNSYEEFDPSSGLGQPRPFIGSQKNIGDGDGNTYYTVIPRANIDRILNAGYGDQPQVTRLDGVGAGESGLRLTEETTREIMAGTSDGTLVYETGAGPINVFVYNPREVVEADFELKLVDEDQGNGELDEEVNWVLTATDLSGNTEVFESNETIERINEQLIEEYGISVAIVQSDEPGDNADDSNGTIEAVKVYSNPDGPQWLGGIPDGGINDGPFPDPPIYDYIKTEPPNGTSTDLDRQSSFAALGDGTWVPYTLCDWNPQSNNQPYLSPAWRSTSSGSVRFSNTMDLLPNVDIVMTADKSMWSRCIVVETASEFYEDFGSGYSTEGDVVEFDLRAGASRNLDGSTDNSTNGLSYFPGYAINVETGERLNIFFGENSIYDCSSGSFNNMGEFQSICDLNDFEGGEDAEPRGRDMIWNPTSERFIQSGFINPNTLLEVYDGGHHMVYVTDEKYDECMGLEGLFRTNDPTSNVNKIKALRKVRWTSYTLANPGTSMLSWDEGLVPNDVTVHLRVDNAYQNYEGVGTNNGNPSYLFNTRGLGPTEVTSDEEKDTALDAISVVPNPYYGFSDYETDQFSNIVKITNLPAKATITIYSLEGKFIRQYVRDEQEMSTVGESNPSVRNRQYLPDLEWDLKNNAGIPVASGVYLIHVSADGLGERTLKWFGVARQFDPSGL